MAIIQRRRGDRGRDEADQGPRRGRPARHPGRGRRGDRPRRRRRPCCACIPAVEELAEKLKGDEKLGAEIVARALAKPVRTIAENCGEDGAVVADEVTTRGEKNPNIGYNANTGEYVDMFKAGIVDPTKVTRSALQNAASIAGLMLTTEVMITKIEDDEKEGAARAEGSVR